MKRSGIDVSEDPGDPPNAEQTANAVRSCEHKTEPIREMNNASTN